MSNRFSTLLPALLAAGAIACSGPSKAPRSAAPDQAKADAATVDRANLDAQLTAFVDSHGRNWGEAYRFSGFALVAHGDEVIYQRGFGHADRNAKSAPTADTSFRIGSVTKQFTAAAILLLAERGKLTIDDPISKHIPDYPAVGAGVTIHQLLTHTSGIPTYTAIPELMKTRDKPRTVAELLESFSDKPLEFDPGNKFSYSNSGYILLGAIIERASGQSYAEFVTQNLFTPAGMSRTAAGDAPGVDDRALGYIISADQLVPAHPIDLSNAYAAGGIRSTANDLLAWHRALTSGKILAPASLEKMYTPEKDDYAYGWRVRQERGHRLISHGGGIDGFYTSYLRVMDADLVIVVWSNNESVKSSRVAEAAFSAAFGGKPEPVPESVQTATDPAVAARVAGRYRITPAGLEALRAAGAPEAALTMFEVVAVRDQNGQVVFEVPGMPPADMSQRGPNIFFNKTHGFEMEFALDATGDAPAERMVLRGAPKPVEYQRVAEGN